MMDRRNHACGQAAFPPTPNTCTPIIQSCHWDLMVHLRRHQSTLAIMTDSQPELPPRWT
ncbi:hypothetical protein BCR44DRAFT_1437664 [Catenaria anguillulae PL171]|uniref:Uncharacterized protein n=1 Tax=Catenaria anguillulae PL171 TaxID=765915 RepID=A0A1Y2HJE2_9FUNG|nr:hypothetical protein BCR44DRAFT_1437664 [Catenaria anguillulae PL171]